MADERLAACGCVAAALSVEGVRASVRFTPQQGSCALPRASLSLFMAFNRGTVLRARRKLGGPTDSTGQGYATERFFDMRPLAYYCEPFSPARPRGSLSRKRQHVRRAGEVG